MVLLIVNDMEPILNFLMTGINWKEYGIDEVHGAYDAANAREILTQQDIDLVLCDIQMPGENGIELIRWVCDTGLDCECIFLTCYANFEYAQEAIHLGCKDYILFPSSAENIGKSVQKVVQQRTEQQDRDQLLQFGQYWLDKTYPAASSDSGFDKTPQKIVDDAIRYILHNLSSPELNVNMLAQNSCLSLSYFSRLFKKTTKISVSQFIIQERMKLALRLLKDPKCIIGNIALDVGYSNYSYFASTFKKYYGCTPTEYKEKNI